MYVEPTMETRKQTFLFFVVPAGNNVNEPPILEAGGYPTGLPLSESTKVGTEVFVLKGHDPEGSPVKYGIQLTDHFVVNPRTGVITLAKPLNREVKHRSIQTTGILIGRSASTQIARCPYLSDGCSSYLARGTLSSYCNILRATSPTSFVSGSLLFVLVSC